MRTVTHPAKPRPRASRKRLAGASAVTILEAMREKELFARWFKDPKTWVYWSVFLASLFGIPVNADGLEIFAQCTGRKAPMAGGYTEAWLCVDRRGGKSLVLALCAVFLAVFKDWSDRLVPGERGTVLVIAQDRKAARVIYRYIIAMITETPLLAGLVDGEPTQDRIDLINGVSIEISTANFRTVRGYTLVAALCDEIAFWQGDDSANPDAEILAALRPAMTTMAPDAMLLCASSPHARKGALWDAYRKFYGKDDAQVLVWQASTKTMHPSVSQRVLDEAQERDPANFVAEYEAQFRVDVENFLAREVVEAAVVEGRFELPPVKGVTYTAFCDPSGGSVDSMTLAIAHQEGNRVVLDVVRERRPPFSPDAVAKEFAECIKSCGLSTVRGDRYAGEWPRERFRAHGVEYKTADKVKSDIYREMLPLINAGRVELLDSVKLVNQLCSLERKVARGGRDSIDHPPKAHDDLANAVAGALVHAAVVKRPMFFAPPEIISGGNYFQSFETARRAPIAGAFDLGGPMSMPPGGWPKNRRD
jgi:hypothetical protein